MAIRLLIRKSLLTAYLEKLVLWRGEHIYNNGLASLMMKMNTEPVTPATGGEGFLLFPKSRSSFKVKIKGQVDLERDEECRIP